MSTPRRWPFFLFLLVGIGAVMLMRGQREPPQQQPPSERAVAVRYIEVPQVTVAPMVSGYGVVRPVRVWEGVAQVKGQIVEKRPQLQRGAIIEPGELLLALDPTDYLLAIAKAEADLAATTAQLQELTVRQQDTGNALQVEQQVLALIERELERKRGLVGRGGVSTSDVENEERALLLQQQRLLGQQSTLNLLPTQRAVLEAQRERHQALLAAARRDLEHTRILMPFQGRIAQVHGELEQYVREGELLLVADDLAAAEIEVQLPLAHFAGLMRVTNSSPEALTAQVRLQESGLTVNWPARLVRISDTLDPQTRTVGVIVEVSEPYAGVSPGVRPPLLKGMFVAVELFAPPRPESLVLPRHAVIHNRVLVIDEEERLQQRSVEVLLAQPQFVVVGAGIAAGERVVVSDLIPAIAGMLLQPLADQSTRERLLEAATGTIPLQEVQSPDG